RRIDEFQGFSRLELNPCFHGLTSLGRLAFTVATGTHARLVEIDVGGCAALRSAAIWIYIRARCLLLGLLHACIVVLSKLLLGSAVRKVPVGLGCTARQGRDSEDD